MSVSTETPKGSLLYVLDLCMTEMRALANLSCKLISICRCLILRLHEMRVQEPQRLRLQRQLFKFNTTSYYHITINTESHVRRATDATVRTQELLHCAMRRQP